MTNSFGGAVNNNYVIDATFGMQDGMFCFCPIDGDPEGDFEIVSGLNYIAPTPPPEARLVAVVHREGQAAVEEFMVTHERELDELIALVADKE